MTVFGDQHKILVYVLKNTSHPLILGTSYLTSQKIKLDFGEFSIKPRTANVRCMKRVVIPPNTEHLIWGQLPQNILYGQQGVCTNSKYILSKGLITPKALVTVSANKTVPIKVLN